MTAYEFEIAAKNSVIDLCKKRYHEDHNLLTVELIHMSSIRRNKKCALVTRGALTRMFIVTLEYGELFVDVYDKASTEKVENPDTDSHWDSLLLSMDY